MSKRRVLSIHRLPRPYRVGLTALWLAPSGILLALLMLRWGLTGALFDLRLLLPLALMMLPALYVWQEGVDALPDGIVRRVHWPRYYAYDQLDFWHYDTHPTRQTLTVWDANRRKALECRAAHLTDLPLLLRTLRENLPGR